MYIHTDDETYWKSFSEEIKTPLTYQAILISLQKDPTGGFLKKDIRKM